MKYGERKFGAARLILAVPTALPKSMRGPIVEVREFSTERGQRGLGHASSLMLKTTVEADLGRFFLFLCVEPDDDTDKLRLIEFYARHGFLPIQSEPSMLMVRPCINQLQTLSAGSSHMTR